MKRFWHGVFHVGMTAVSVAAVAGYLAPFPFNIAIVGGASVAQGVVALHHHPAPVQVSPSATTVNK